MLNKITSVRLCGFALGALFMIAQPRPAAAQALQPYTETVPGTVVKWDMVPVGAGPHTKAFWMAKTETTWDAYDIFAFHLDRADSPKAQAVDAISRPSKPYGAPDRGFGHQGHPALAMTHEAAQQFCRWLSAKTGKRYRLPTVVEWEHAARAGARPGPLPAKELDKVAWYWNTTEDKTEPVGTKAANAWGLHDTLGNVAEWCTNGDRSPVVCGGSFVDKAAKVQVGARTAPSPAWNATDPQNPKSKWWLADAPFVGFRVVCQPKD